jgi:Mg-chelatase subunit ChlI
VANPIGTITRGTTHPNRLRRSDRWIAAVLGPELRRTPRPIVVDLGFGASPVTTVELQQRLRAVVPDVRVIGLEIDPQRVAEARRRQRQRQARTNARLEGSDLVVQCQAEPAALELLARALHQLGLSARAYHRVLRVARTIADLAGSPGVAAGHIAEAIALRQLDRRPAASGQGASVSV